MNPIRALLWKEGREAAYKTVFGAGLALLLGLGHIDLDFPIETVCHLVGVLGAVLMGMDLVAGERSRGTLSFLLSRPLSPGQLLAVKFAVGAAGLLAVLAAYWAGVYLGMPEWGNTNFPWGLFWDPGNFRSPYQKEILTDVGYGRILLLWFFLYMAVYAAVFLASTLRDSPLKAAVTGLMVAWVGFFFLGISAQLLSDAAWYYITLVFETDLDWNGGILRQAFDPSLVLARAVGALLLAAGVLLWVRKGLQVPVNRRFQWIMSSLVLVSFRVIVVGRMLSRPAEDPVEPVVRLPYEKGITDLALKDRLAVVLLENGVSVVDVADWQAPKETGRAEIDGWRLWRLALSGTTAYAWGSAEGHDSVGVAVFDVGRPERPRLRSQRFLHPIEAGPTPWLKLTPRLVGWAVWEGHLYAGLLGNEFLELHSFDVRDGGLPQPVNVLRIEETGRHVWNNDWEMRLGGPHAFLTLGHDFVVLDLTDPAHMKELSRTPLRRFGRSRQYEKSIEDLHHQLTPGVLPESVAQKLEEATQRLESLEMQEWTPEGEYVFYRIAAPRGLGPISLIGGRAYVQRYWPRELAVLDIGDPRRPEEIDFFPGESFSGELTMDGDYVYSLSTDWISAYEVARYGALLPRKTLHLGNGVGDPRDRLLRTETRTLRGKAGDLGDLAELSGSLAPLESPPTSVPYQVPPMPSTLIPVGDHICAVMKNHLVIFKALQND